MRKSFVLSFYSEADEKGMVAAHHITATKKEKIVMGLNEHVVKSCHFDTRIIQMGISSTGCKVLSVVADPITYDKG